MLALARLCYIGSLLLVLVLWGLGNSASAQSNRTLDVQRFRPAFDDAGFIGLDGTRTLPPYRFAFTLAMDLAIDPVELELDGDEYEPLEERFVTHLAAEMGLLGRLNVALYLPLIVHQQGEILPMQADDLDAFAVGDPEIALRYRFLGVNMAERDAPRDGPGLALQLSASVPVGTKDAYAGEGAVRTEAALLGDFQLLGAGAGASLGWRHHFRDAPDDGLPKHDEFTFAVGLKLPLPPLPELIPVLEFRGATAFEAHTTALELGLGVNGNFGDVILTLAGSVGLSDGYGTPDGRVVLGVRWSPSESDKDGDGIDDSKDQCPYLAEDPDGFNDSDGCPDPDNDNDLIPDLDDRCPDEQAEEGRDEDEDGCTDPK
ncbi:MAG TPA: hypothetical protein VJV78_06975 [Polyangiales bacterium]|nr:hypothetical protein [Polyangiales bacterium]